MGTVGSVSYLLKKRLEIFICFKNVIEIQEVVDRGACVITNHKCGLKSWQSINSTTL